MKRKQPEFIVLLIPKGLRKIYPVLQISLPTAILGFQMPSKTISCISAIPEFEFEHKCFFFEQGINTLLKTIVSERLLKRKEQL